ncbi:MAG: TolB family protein [Chloroflexota bacterium]
MKKITHFFYLALVVFLSSCSGIQATSTLTVSSQPSSSALPSSTPLPDSERITAVTTPTTSTATISPTATRTDIPTIPTETQAGTPTIPVDTRIQRQCIDIAPKLPPEFVSSGKVLLASYEVIDEDHYQSKMSLLDMVSGQFTQIDLQQDEMQSDNFVSPDGKLRVFRDAIVTDGQIIKEELVISDESGLQLEVLPWEVDWYILLGWLGNQNLAITLWSDGPFWEPPRKLSNLLVLNPFTNERQIIQPDFPEYFEPPWSGLPYWDGWQGAIYDPTFTRVIYPQMLGDNKMQYTYAIWDISKQQLVTSLEGQIAAFTDSPVGYPIPRWSPDGSQVIFKGILATDPEAWTEFELFRVTRDGEVAQWTNLGPDIEIPYSTYSWSPDNKHIATLLRTGSIAADDEINHAEVAVLDTATLAITNYCIPINYVGLDVYYSLDGPFMPVWSPDGTQFLVVDRYNWHDQRVILVDIVQGFAAPIAEDMEPVGWMK